MGILQGIAEFLPISSSGHLALFQHFFAMENVEESQMFFTVLLHFATLIAVCVYYWQDIIDMIREFFLGIRDLASRGRRGREKLPPARRLVLLIIVATLPLFVVLPIKDLVEGAMSNVTFVSFALLATGFILFFSDRMARGRKTERTATVLDALLVGCAQALGTLPGISRSGSTISVGQLCGLERSYAVSYSFILGLPAVLAAGILDLHDAATAGIGIEWGTALIGMAAALIFGLLAIRLVNYLIKSDKFRIFAIYTLVLGSVVVILGIVEKITGNAVRAFITGLIH